MNLGSTALQVLKTVAPTIALAVGGPFGPLAAAALHVALGTSGDKDAEAALTGVTPDQLLALKKAENDFQVQLKTLEISEAQLAFSDTANARQREEVVKDKTPMILAFLFVTGWFSIQTFILTHVIDPAMRDIVLRTMGTMDMALGLILSYYFGSSAGSAKKDTTISNMAKS
jgi:hypothetical protein